MSRCHNGTWTGRLVSCTHSVPTTGKVTPDGRPSTRRRKWVEDGPDLTGRDESTATGGGGPRPQDRCTGFDGRRDPGPTPRTPKAWSSRPDLFLRSTVRHPKRDPDRVSGQKEESGLDQWSSAQRFENTGRVGSRSDGPKLRVADNPPILLGGLYHPSRDPNTSVTRTTMADMDEFRGVLRSRIDKTRWFRLRGEGPVQRPPGRVTRCDRGRP